jgi:hypothetical protein
MKRICFVVIIFSGLLLLSAANAQNSLLQDGKGEAAFYNEDGSYLSFNPGDGNVRLNYLRFCPDHVWVNGFNLEVKSKDGIGSLLSNGVLNPQGTVGVYFRRKYGKKDGQHIVEKTDVNCRKILDSQGLPIPVTKDKFIYDNPKYLYFVLKSRYSSVKELRKDTLAADNRFLFGFTGEVAYNSFFKIRNKHTGIFGVSLNGNLADNTELLRVITDSIAPNIQSVREEEIKAYENGALKKEIFIANLNVDLGIYPAMFNQRVLISLHWRSRYIGLNNTTVRNIGLGIYFTGDKTPRNIIGGINFFVNDLANENSKDQSVWKRSSINVTVGFKPFG